MAVDVSIVVPLYNKAPYIGRAVSSILNQTFQNFELVIVDDGSTDEGVSIIKNFKDPRIKIIHQENSGVSIARNTGIRNSAGKLIAFLDADDEWTPGHLEALVRLWKGHPQAGMFATAFKVGEPGSPFRSPVVRAIPPPPWKGILPNYFEAAARSDFLINSSSVAIPKNVLMDTGGFIPGEGWGEDLDLWMRIALKYPVAFAWEGESIYHRGISDQVTGSVPHLHQQPMVVRAMNEIKNNHVPATILPYFKEYIVRQELLRALWHIKSGYPKEARKILENCTTRYFLLEKIRLQILSYLPVSLFQVSWRWYRHTRKVLFHHDYSLDSWTRNK